MFVDSVNIKVIAGKGGDGIVSFHREKYVDRGGPDGGKGGKGGDVIFVGESGLTTLLDFRFNRKIKAESGTMAGKNNMFGKDGASVKVKVPLGTVVTDTLSGKVLADITVDKEEVIIAKGGRGGRGNAFFATSRNVAPDFCEKGFKGEEFDLRLDLKVLADAGLVGFPSVGKSTILSVVSKAKPKIADYHFTTLHPNLGVVGVKDGRSFIMADLPGLIENASQGEGLGIEFLKHVERCKVIVHVIDMASLEGRDPYEDYLKIRKELGEFNKDLLTRPELIVANKCDLPDFEANLNLFKQKIDQDVISISAYQKIGIDEMLYKIADCIDQNRDLKINEVNLSEKEVEYNYVSPEPLFSITKLDDGTFNVTGNYIRKLFDRCDFTKETSVRLFAKKLKDIGVDQKLRELGVKHGDTVVILDEYEFEFYD